MQTQKQRKPFQLPLFKATGEQNSPRTKTKRWWVEKRLNYGGEFDYRKVARPETTKKLVHVVVKANMSRDVHFLKSQTSLNNLIDTSAKRYNLTVQKKALTKNHFHLLIYSRDHEQFRNWLRFLACELGRVYKRLFRQYGVSRSRPLFSFRPFTRIVSWGRKARRAVELYIDRNRDEALGFRNYKPRNHAVNRFLTWWNKSDHSLLSPVA